MAPTIRETIEGLIGTVIRGGDWFNSGENMKGIPYLHPKERARINKSCDSANAFYDHIEKSGGLGSLFLYDPDFGDEPRIDDISRQQMISHLNEMGLVVKALVKVSGSDSTTVKYQHVDEHVVLGCEDEGHFAGYDLVLWGDLAIRYPDEDFDTLREKGIRPPIIRYIKPELKTREEQHYC